jgi:hypothetical protein
MANDILLSLLISSVDRYIHIVSTVCVVTLADSIIAYVTKEYLQSVCVLVYQLCSIFKTAPVLGHNRSASGAQFVTILRRKLLLLRECLRKVRYTIVTGNEIQP